MMKITKRAARLKLPARIRNRRKTSGDFSARMALIDRIAELRGIETVECNDETVPRRVEICLRQESTDPVLKRKPAPTLCRLDCNGVTVNGLSRWEKYQVLANGWGRLIDNQVCVHLPRDHKELDIVWRIIRQAYDRLLDTSTSEPGSAGISTRNFPRFSRTSLQ
jgi:hypothetical protein